MNSILKENIKFLPSLPRQWWLLKMVLYKLSLSFCSKVLLPVSREIPQQFWSINSAATQQPCWEGISHLENSFAQKRDGWSHLSILRGLCNSKVLKSNHCIWWLSCRTINQGYHSLAQANGVLRSRGTFFWPNCYFFEVFVKPSKKQRFIKFWVINLRE